MSPKKKAADTVKVKCSECGKTSEVLASSVHDDGDTIWQCPQPGDDGTLCGAKNVIEA